MARKTPQPPEIPDDDSKLRFDAHTGELLARADGKDPLAVLLGRRGGLKGGRARADALSAEKRQQIAQAAARKRWGGKP